MKIITCSVEVNEIVELLTSREFLNLNPVIAGGFVHWLFELAYTKPLKVSETLASIRNVQKMNEIMGLSETSMRFNYQNYRQINSFGYGDIDSWFLSNNPIWQEGNEYHNLVKPGVYKTEIHAIGSSLGFMHLRHESDWAYTFEKESKVSKKGTTLQVILKMHQTVEETLDSFDLNGCKIAWHDGKFYLTEEFMGAISRGRIEIHDDHWNRAHHFQKVQTALRAFKYHRRTGRPISKDSIEKIFELYQEVLEHPLTKKHIIKPANSPIAVIANVFSKILPGMNAKSAHNIVTYGGSRAHNRNRGGENLLVSQHRKLIGDFICFISQDEFDDSMLAYFVNSGVPAIDELVKVGMDYASGARPKIKVHPPNVADDLFDDLLEF